jgi:hypothetical protein
MEPKRIGKAMVSLAVIMFALVFCVGDVLAWNWGVHAYIDDNLGKSGPLRNMNEIYGGVGPDVFNYMFDDPQLREYLFQKTHEDFMGLWRKACTPLGKAEAYGFVSHNELWGADHTAHIQAQTLGEDATDGYVIAKAKAIQLAAGTGQLLLPDGTTLPPLESLLPADTPEEVKEVVALVFYHNLVEAAVDILLIRDHPAIGKKLASSAILRSPEFPLLLVGAYAKDVAQAKALPYLEAVKLITASEKEFRKSVVLYGQALMQAPEDENGAIQALSEQMTEIAVAYLAAYGITLAPALVEQLPMLANAYINVAMFFCAADYADEIAATIEFVKEGLNSHHISY